MKIITMDRLNRALEDVARDFDHLGIWNERIYSVEVFLTPAGYAYGYKYNHGRKGHIEVPAISLCRLSHKLMGIGSGCGLRDLLRHEYGHALADLYPRLSRSRAFIKAFGGSYDRESPVRTYDPEHHVTRYAASQPCEDFCEVFMYYVKHRGRLPARFDTPQIKRKWRFARTMINGINGT